MFELTDIIPVSYPEMRTVFRQTLASLMEQDRSIVVLEADLGGASGFTKLKPRFPDRFIEMGISEANMIGAACGMSMRGFVPFVHTFAPFASRRCADQIFLAGAYSRNTINIYASDPGVCACTNGGTHTAFEDLGFIRTLPGALVFDPADGVQLEWLIRALAPLAGVHYIRTSRKLMRPIDKEGSTFEIGKGNIVRPGTDVLLIAMGELLSEAMDAADILASRGISAEVIDMFTVKPIDEELILREAAGKRAVITCENHGVINGLGSAVAEVMAEHPMAVPLRRIGVRERFGQVGNLEFLKKDYGLKAADIAAAI